MYLVDDGWRARIGIVVPSANTVVEPWFSRTVPTGVSVHVGRMLIDPVITPESLEKMDKEGMGAVSVLATCRPDVIMYGCTASTIVAGRAHDLKLMQEMKHVSGLPCYTATEAILQALAKFDVQKISIASPYPEAVDHKEVEFFRECGVETLSVKSLGISQARMLAQPSPEEIYRLARDAWNSESDALFISCLNFRSQYVIAALEQDLERPVITSTQATLWLGLRAAGVREPIAGYGRLLTEY